ncbi:hypothetical protein L1987_01697 [Smallanthus sonchifolius]|uniref:Uncharacterized protein n=1 Tax=Smallanthus sonchifolius TaxID=185202 RepID=A0ACB9K5V2_9ASTR|nr:hypothetical protein L1987_01697 [Smallanthus sonchifolius]
MANLVFKSDHNICACLDVHAPNSGDYHDLIEYLKHSKVYFALSIDPVIYEDSIRTHLHFNDAANDPAALSPATVIQTFRRMGYEGEFNHTTIRKCSSSSSSDNDDGANDDNPHGEEENNNDNVEFDQEELHTQDSPPRQDMVPTPVHKSPDHILEDVMPSWAITLQNQKKSLQKAVAKLTSLVSNLSSTVNSQDKKILKLKKENKRLKLLKSLSKPKKFKRLVRGPPPRPFYKNFVVSSSTSSPSSIKRQGENIEKEVFDSLNGDDYGPSAPADHNNADDADQGSPIGVITLSPPKSPVKVFHFMFSIFLIKRFIRDGSKSKLSIEMEEGLSRKKIDEMLRQDELEAKAHAEADLAKAAAKSLSSILSKQPEENKSEDVPRKYARVYLRRKVSQEVHPESSVVIISEDSPAASPKSTPRKKSIPKRIIEKQSDIVIPGKDKYRKLYESEFVKSLTLRDIKRMVYLFEHGMKWEEIFEMSMKKIEDFVHEIKSKMSKEDLERGNLIFFLKANNQRSKQLKNMKTENLKKLVNEIKLEKETEKVVQKEKELEKEKENVVQKEVAKKRILEVGSSNYDTKSFLFKARLKEIDATKLKPNVNVEEVSKEIFSSHAGEVSVKAYEESKATWFKKKHESSSNIVDSFKAGIQNFSSTTLKEKITSLRYDSRKYVLAETKMLATHPKGYDLENFLKRMARDGFQAFKKNPKVPQRRLTRFNYNAQAAVARKIVRNKAPTAVLPQYNEEYTNNFESLQPCTKAYVNDAHELVVERGENLKPLYMYELAQIRILTNGDIFALAAMRIAFKPKHEFDARDFANLLTKVSMDRRGIEYDLEQTYVLDHHIGGGGRL